jgi:hypothetical protein
MNQLNGKSHNLTALNLSLTLMIKNSPVAVTGLVNVDNEPVNVVPASPGLQLVREIASCTSGLSLSNEMLAAGM